MTTPYVILVVFVAVALGLSAFALWVALNARTRSIRAEGRFARHQEEHRLGVEATGLRRHRAGSGPSTQQVAAAGRTREERGRDYEEEEPEVGPSTPSGSSSANLATVEHAGPGGRFRRPPPPVPLPPPGRIGGHVQ